VNTYHYSKCLIDAVLGHIKVRHDVGLAIEIGAIDPENRRPQVSVGLPQSAQVSVEAFDDFVNGRLGVSQVVGQSVGRADADGDAILDQQIHAVSLNWSELNAQNFSLS
jgi:hypothetical protein